MIKVGIIGVGTVGSSVIKNIQKHQKLLQAKTGKKIEVVKAAVKDLSKKRDVNVPLTDSYEEIINDPEIDIVVELIGGIDKAYEIVKKALLNNKAVVTANKALLAYHRFELEKIANTPFYYEASVAGGIPIIQALRDGLSANDIIGLQGIINGTSNYILTEMKNNRNYEEVLREAQKLGYAEADPTFDIGGFDAAHKLLILASLAYNIDAKPEDILIEGIEKINLTDIEFAKEFGYEIKLLGIAKKIDNEVELRVHPTMIKNNQMLAKVDGVMNAISIIGDVVGETLYYGPGAGGDATASAVIGDIVEIARGNNAPMLGFIKKRESLKLKNIENILSKYYLRISVDDKIGILEKIAHILAENNISIESFLQKSKKVNAKLLLSTHKCYEKDIQNAIKEIKKLEYVKDINFIRIEV